MKNQVRICLLFMYMLYSNPVYLQNSRLDEEDYQMAIINLRMKESYYYFDSSFKNLKPTNTFTTYLNSQYYYTFLIFSKDSTVDISNYTVQSSNSINTSFDKGDNSSFRKIQFSRPELSGNYSFTVVTRSKDTRPVSIMVYRSTYLWNMKKDFDVNQLTVNSLFNSIIEVNLINEGFKPVISTQGMKKKPGDKFSLKLDRRNEYRLLTYHSQVINTDYDKLFNPQLSSVSNDLELRKCSFGKSDRIFQYNIIPPRSKTFEFHINNEMKHIVDSLIQLISNIDAKDANLTMSKDSIETFSTSVSSIKNAIAKLDYTVNLYGKQKEFVKNAYMGYTTLTNKVGFGAFIGFVSAFDPVYGAYIGFYATSSPEYEYEDVKYGLPTGNVKVATEVKFTFGPTISYNWGFIYAGLGVGSLNVVSEYSFDPNSKARKWDKNRWGSDDKYGLALESGVVLNLGKRFYAGLGCGTTNFLTLEPSIHLGYHFTKISNK